MGLNDLSETSLRDYLLAIVGLEPDSPQELNMAIPSLALEVHRVKKILRRKSDDVTHERVFAKLLLEVYKIGKDHGLRKGIDSIREGIEKIEWEKSDG